MNKEILVWIGVAAGAAGNFLFGYDRHLLLVLMTFMFFDIELGVCMALLGKSKKSLKGYFSATEMWKGIVRKTMTLILVSCAHILDKELGLNYLFTGTVWAFIANEFFSILETYGTSVQNPPEILMKILDTLKDGGKKL